MREAYKQQVQRDFDHASTQYDDMAHIQHRQYINLYAFARQQVFQALGKTDHAKSKHPRDTPIALDIGSGPGAGLAGLQRKMAQDNLSLRWVALDLSKKMLLQQQGGIQLLLADMNSLPIANESFDFVCCSFALHWSLTPAVALSEIIRILAPSGLAMVSLPVHGSLELLHNIWRDHDLTSPLHPMPTQEDILLEIERLDVRQSVPQTMRNIKSSHTTNQLPLDFARAKDVLSWLRETGVKRKSTHKTNKMKVNKSQYLSIMKQLDRALQQEALTFSMLNIVLRK